MVEDSLLKEIRSYRDFYFKKDVKIDSTLTVGGGSAISKFVVIGSHLGVIVGTDTFYIKTDSL